MQTYPPVTIEYSQTTETNLSLTSAWASGCVLLYPNHFLYNSLIVVIELSQSRTSRTHFEPVLTQCPSPEQACHCWFCSFKKKSSNLHFCNVVTLWCVHVPFCVSQNLFNQGLQFDLSSATFIRIVSKKKKPSSSALYIYIWFSYYSDIGLNILANTWNFNYIEFFRMCELPWNQMLNWREDLCQSDSLCSPTQSNI